MTLMHHQDGSDSPTVQRTHLSVSPPSAQRRAPVTQWLVRPGVYLVLTLLLTFHHSDLYADRSGGLGPPGPPSFSVFISPLPPTPSRSPDPPLTERSKTHRPVQIKAVAHCAHGTVSVTESAQGPKCPTNITHNVTRSRTRSSVCNSSECYGVTERNCMEST